MIFLSVNHNLLYTILGTYPPGPFRNNQNHLKKFPFFQQHFSSAEISSMQNFSSAGNLLERPTVFVRESQSPESKLIQRAKEQQNQRLNQQNFGAK